MASKRRNVFYKKEQTTEIEGMENNSSVDLIGGEEADIGRPRKSRVKGLVWLLSFFKLSKDRTPNLEDCKIECSRMSPDQCHMLLTPDGQERPKKITQRTQSRLVQVLKFLFLIVGITCASIMWLTDVYDNTILKLVSIRNDIDVVFDLWQNPPTRPILSVYVFNYTNFAEALEGKEKPRVKEVGPFVFRERMQRINIHFNENKTVSFQENRTITYLPEESHGSINDTIRVPNIYLLAALNTGRKMYYVGQKVFSSIMSQVEVEPFQEVTINDFIWGYQDKFFELVSNLSQFLNQEKLHPFGFLAKRKGVHGDVVTVESGLEDVDRVAVIHRYDGASSIGHWSDARCDLIEGSEGAQFPGRMASHHKPLFIYSKDMCRRLPIKYSRETHSVDGFPVVEYLVPDDLFEYTNNTPENMCYKYDDAYPPDGVFYTGPCHKGVPMYISFPHFWQGSEELHEKIKGLEPNEYNHRSSFLIHNRLGICLLAKTRFQINIMLKKAPYIYQYTGVEDGTIFPIAWMEYNSGPLPEYFVDIIYHLTFTVRYIQQAFKWLSLISLIAGLYLVYKEFQKHYTL